MGGGRRQSTVPFGAPEFELVKTTAERGPMPTALGSDRPLRDNRPAEHRPTCKLSRDELLGLLHEATPVPAPSPAPMIPAPPIVAARAVAARHTVELEDEDRLTRKMNPKHFQLMVRTQRAGVPLSPDDIMRMGEDEVEALLSLSAHAEPAPVVAKGSAASMPRLTNEPADVVAASSNEIAADIDIEPVPVVEPVTATATAPPPAFEPAPELVLAPAIARRTDLEGAPEEPQARSARTDPHVIRGRRSARVLMVTLTAVIAIATSIALSAFV